MGVRWSLSGLASLGTHGAFVLGCLWWSVRHPFLPFEQRPTELEVRSVPAAVAPAPLPTVTPVPTVRGHARPARGVNLGPMARIPTSHEDGSFVAPRIGVPDGDEDSTLDDPSPSMLQGAPGPAPAGPPAAEREIAPLEAAYLCTYQSLRGLPRSLYVRGKVYRLLVQMCIDAQGRVASATLQKGAATELDAQVLTDMRAWRYRPRIVHGKPSAFCYKVRVSYEVE
jgi:hypothetical protein